MEIDPSSHHNNLKMSQLANIKWALDIKIVQKREAQKPTNINWANHD